MRDLTVRQRHSLGNRIRSCKPYQSGAKTQAECTLEVAVALGLVRLALELPRVIDRASCGLCGSVDKATRASPREPYDHERRQAGDRRCNDEPEHAPAAWHVPYGCVVERVQLAAEPLQWPMERPGYGAAGEASLGQNRARGCTRVQAGRRVLRTAGC